MEHSHSIITALPSDSPILYAIIGAIGIAMATGPLGCYLIWRRMSYFSEALAHSALLGVSIGLMFHVNTNLIIMISCIVLALLLMLAKRYLHATNDSIINILAHSLLAIGVIIISISGQEIDIEALLFGDILSISKHDIITLYIVMGAALAALLFIWERLIAITFDENLASAEGINAARTHFVFILILALVIAFAMQIVGVLLTTSLLIIPASSAYKLSKNPEQMAVYASLIGIFDVVTGIYLSKMYNIPSGPAIIVVATLIFIITAFIPRKS